MSLSGRAHGIRINCTVGDYLKQIIERLEALGKYASACKHRVLCSHLAQFRSLNIRKDIFLFSYFTAGINFTDMATLRYGDIVDGRIYYSRHKTQKQLSFQLVPNALQIIQKYSKTEHMKDDSLVELSHRILDSASGLVVFAVNIL